MNFNEKLISLRKEKGWSQEELGNKVGVARQTVSKWELGETTPEMDKLVLLSNVFNKSLDELIKEDSQLSPNIDIKTETIQKRRNNNDILKIILLNILIITIISVGIIITRVNNYYDDQKVKSEINGVEEEEPTRDINLSRMKKITSNQVKEIKENMSCSDIKNLLGETFESGFGAYILNYIIDNNYILTISFSSMAQPANINGEKLLDNLMPIEEYMNPNN